MARFEKRGVRRLSFMGRSLSVCVRQVNVLGFRHASALGIFAKFLRLSLTGLDSRAEST